jgi:small subunit ribosomal protein S3
MGQKVNPNGMRLGITKQWTANWYAPTEKYANYLIKDIEVRQYLTKKLGQAAGVSKILIERPAHNSARVAIYSARPGVIIGKKGSDVETLRKKVSQIMQVPVHLTIEEVRKPDLEAKLVAENIASQLERRVMFRRVMKRAVQTGMRHGAQGVKVCLAGRLAGAEIARTEKYREGRVPLHTFRADIDYATAIAQTTYGIIGVKVWIFKGEMHLQRKESPKKASQEETTETTED